MDASAKEGLFGCKKPITVKGDIVGVKRMERYLFEVIVRADAPATHAPICLEWVWCQVRFLLPSELMASQITEDELMTPSKTKAEVTFVPTGYEIESLGVLLYFANRALSFKVEK